jgi:hypothetical protein
MSHHKIIEKSLGRAYNYQDNVEKSLVLFSNDCMFATKGKSH